MDQPNRIIVRGPLTHRFINSPKVIVAACRSNVEMLYTRSRGIGHAWSHPRTRVSALETHGGVTTAILPSSCSWSQNTQKAGRRSLPQGMFGPATYGSPIGLRCEALGDARTVWLGREGCTCTPSTCCDAAGGELFNLVTRGKTPRRRGFCVVARSHFQGDLSLIPEKVREEAVGDLFSTRERGTGDYLVSGYGWRVRDASRFDTEELRVVAQIQASAFHSSSALFDDLFFKLFKAEVLSALIYKARHSPADRYACLLAEIAMDLQPDSLGTKAQQSVVGVVNLTALVDKDVLCHLQGAYEYLYVSGMAVDASFRRQNVATLLLQACDSRALQWGFDYLVLHAYEDDDAAQNLYSRAGFKTVALDPLWLSTWVGRKRRVIMAKKISIAPNSFLPPSRE